jgi:hypothetical protein
MVDPDEMLTMAGAIDALTGRGYTEHFTLRRGRLRGAVSGKVFEPDEVALAEIYRFEGVSDPDDMAILYALEAPGGVRGTLADAFGVYADPAVGAFMAGVPSGTGSASARARARAAVTMAPRPMP